MLSTQRNSVRDRVLPGARRPESHANWIRNSDEREESTEGDPSRAWTSVYRERLVQVAPSVVHLLHGWMDERDEGVGL